MKFKALNNEPFQFYNAAGELMGTISISGSGDMILRPESGSSRDVIIGDPTQVGDVEMGGVGTPISLKILGGGTITGNGNTLNIGSATDVVNLYNVVYSQSFDVTGSLDVTGSITANTFVGDGAGVTGVISSSYALTASHALNGGGGGGGTPGGSDTQVQFNDGGSFGGDAGFTFNKTTNSITAITHVTASGNISSSANVIAKTGSFSHLEGNSPITVGDQINFQQPLTASIISASSYVGSITSATTSSYAISASHLIGGGGSVPGGTVSGSAQITELGFVTSSATSSFALTADVVANAQTGSFVVTGSAATLNSLIISHPSGNLVPGDGSTSSIAVTVDGNQKFVLDGTVTASISLIAGNAYKFDTSDSSNNGHPFAFKESGSGTDYTTGVTVNGSSYTSPDPGDSGAYVQISVTNNTPNLIYYCTVHGTGMGGDAVLSITTGSVIQNGFLDITGSLDIISGSANIDGHITASGNISGSGTIDITGAATFGGITLTDSNYDANGSAKYRVDGYSVLQNSSTTLKIAGNNYWERLTYGNEDTDRHEFTGNITASANISASGYISASMFVGAFSGSFENAVSASYALTASHALNAGGGSSETNFTQSLFVTPSGDDGTAVVGDMLKPFATILAATHSANVGDTIIVYPGTHAANDNIIKEGVNYYFYPGAYVSGGSGVSIMNGTYDTVNVRGYGQFIGGGSFGVHNALIELEVNKTSYLEFDYVRTTSTGNSYESNLRVGTSDTTADIEYFKIKGNVEMTGSGGGSLVQALSILKGNVEFEGRVHVAASKNAGTQAIDIDSDASDVWIKADAYAAEGEALYSHARQPHAKIEGKYETGTQGTYYAMQFADTYQGQHLIDAEVIGSIRIHPGENAYGGVKFRGYQNCDDAPSNNGALYIQSGYNQIDAQIYVNDATCIHVEGGHTVFNGIMEVNSNGSTRLFDVSAGLLHFKGSNDENNKRCLSSEISGGELIIDSFLQNYGGNYPNNEFAFNLSGGTLEINNKVVYHQQTTGSGIVDMTGGYLKLNGAQLIHADGTGSYAYCVKLNGADRSGSLFNNSFTNLRPFSGDATFTNEIVGGGTLFESDKLY